MNSIGWDRIVLSDERYNNLVCELYFDGVFLMLLDRENGRDQISVTISEIAKNQYIKFSYDDLLLQLQEAKDDLIR